MSKAELLVVWPIRPKAMAQLEASCICHHLHSAADPDSLVGEVADRIRGIVTIGEKGASRALIERLPNLEIIACFGVGVDAIDLDAARAKGVIVTNTPDVLSRDVADMGLALMLMTMRRMVEADRYAREGGWQKGPFVLGRSPRGKTLGIVGLGRIGLELAKRAQALEMRVVYYNRGRRDVPFDYAPSVVELARQADVLALCCPGGAATAGIVNAAVLEALGPDGYLINIARGSVVDEPALIAALEAGKIAGAGLDVFAAEPHVPPALAAMGNVVLSPHQASATIETRDAMAQLVVDNLAAHLAGKPVITRIA